MKKAFKVLCLAMTVICVFLLGGCFDAEDLAGTMLGKDFIVKIGDASTGYASFGEAWKAANETTSEEVTIVCYDDVTAVDGMFGEYGELTVNERSESLTLDLNGHTLDRGLTDPIDSGAVFAFFNQTGVVTIKNGTITGGNKNEHGGGIYIDSDNLNLTLENITVTGNNAGINGGGMYINGCTAYVTLDNTTVTGNTARFGGGIHWDEKDDKMAALCFEGKVLIRNNNATDDADYNNLVINPFRDGISDMSFDFMSEQSEIHFAYETCIEMPFTDSLNTDAERYRKCFVSERSEFTVEVNDEQQLYLKLDEENNTRFAAGVYRDSWGYWEYFTSCASAWTEADSHKAKVTMKLYQDWTANENGNLGEGNGFHDGAILAYTRDEDAELTLDLNGHTINRGLTKENARENGCIFYLDDDYSPHIAVKNGTLTGGANTKEGGCIDDRADHGVFWLDNVTITGNYSAKEGSAIYYDVDYNYVCLRDVTITDNESGVCGSLYVYSSLQRAVRTVRLNLYGNIKVKDNEGGNLCFSCHFHGPFYTEFSDDIEPGSIVLYFDDMTESVTMCIVDGDPEISLKAFNYTNSAVRGDPQVNGHTNLFLNELGIYESEDGKTYLGIPIEQDD